MQQALLLMRAHSLGALVAWGARLHDGVDQRLALPLELLPLYSYALTQLLNVVTLCGFLPSQMSHELGRQVLGIDQFIFFHECLPIFLLVRA